MPVSGARYDDNTHRNMDIEVENTDKNIRIHEVKSTGQLMNLILERLNYFLNNLLRTFKITQMSYITLHMKSRRRLKPFL